MSAAAFTLDAEQLDAIRASGTLLVKAGAGSGKTEVLARRFVALTATNPGNSGHFANRSTKNGAPTRCVQFIL